MLTYLKAALFTIAALVCILIGYILISFNSDYEANLAFEAFSKGEYDKAEEIAQNLKSHLSDEQVQLDLAYIARAKQNLELSNKHLKEAETAASRHHNAMIGLEIALNQAYNGYLTHNQQDMKTAIEQATAIAGPQNEWVQFFAGSLSNYSKLIPLSPWMKRSFDVSFTPFWNKIARAKQEIDAGNTLKARQQLEQMSQNAHGIEAQDLELALGLSYLKEAEQTSPAAATPYFKLAFGYFGRVPLQDERYAQERSLIIKAVSKQFEARLEQDNYKDLSFYVQALESLKAAGEIEQLHRQLVQKLGGELKANNWQAVQEIALALNSLILDPEKRQAIAKLFGDQLELTLDNANFSDIQNGVEVARLFSVNLSQNLHQASVKNILELLPIDNSDLSLTLPQIDIWLRSEQDPKKRYAFALELLAVASILWENDKESEKALSLSLAAASIPALTDQKAFQIKVEETIRHVYQTALQKNDLVLLRSIQKALRQLNLTHLILQEQNDLTRQQDQAERFYNEKEYEKAGQKAAWILQEEPTNQQALRIAGLADYQLTLYSQALPLLRKVKNPDRAVQVALAVSETLAGDVSKSLNENLDGDAYLKLGFGLLLQQKPKESLVWFKKVPQPNPEATVGVLCAYYMLENWNGVVETFTLLHPPYSSLVSLQSQTYDALVHLGQFSEAEQLAHSVLKGDVPLENSAFPLVFQVYKKNRLDYLSSNFLRGVSLKYANDYSGALASFVKSIQQLQPFLLLEMGDAYSHLGQPLEARLALLKGIKQLQSPDYLVKALPLLVEIEQSLGLDIEAWQHAAHYFKLFPHEMSGRARYAELLMRLGLYDLSLKELRQLESRHLLENRDRVSYVASLIHTGDFEEAESKGKSWTAALPLAEKLEMARLLLIAGDSSFVQKTLETLPSINEIPVPGKIALLQLYRELGNFDLAQKVAKYPELQQSPAGLLALAELEADLSNPKEALKLARLSLERDPDNSAAATFIEPYDASLTAIQARLDTILAKKTIFPDSPTLKMEEAHALIDLAIEQHALSPDTPFHDNSALRRARLILDMLVDNNKEVPRFFFLQGESAFLLDDAPQTLNAFQSAIHLNVSYTQAYKYLGLAYAALKQPNDALQAMENAIKYDPNDAEAWSELAAYQQNQGMDLDALQSWQQVIKYHPRDSFAYYNLGQLKSSLRDIEGARLALEKALEFSPQNVKALKLLLITLYDPQLDTSESHEPLLQQQKKVYDALHALNPKEAEELLSKLTKGK